MSAKRIPEPTSEAEWRVRAACEMNLNPYKKGHEPDFRKDVLVVLADLDATRERVSTERQAGRNDTQTFARDLADSALRAEVKRLRDALVEIADDGCVGYLEGRSCIQRGLGPSALCPVCIARAALAGSTSGQVSTAPESGRSNDDPVEEGT